MLFARYLMVITMLSNNLSSFHYFLDILDGVPLLLDTNQRGNHVFILYLTIMFDKKQTLCSLHKYDNKVLHALSMAVQLCKL